MLIDSLNQFLPGNSRVAAAITVADQLQRMMPSMVFEVSFSAYALRLNAHSEGVEIPLWYSEDDSEDVLTANYCREVIIRHLDCIRQVLDEAAV